MNKIKYKNKTYEIDKENLGKIISEAFKEIQNKEMEEGGIPVSGGVGLFALAMQSGAPPCMACGSFVDYTGKCNYTSQITVIKDDKEYNNLCQVYDTPLVHAIEQNKLTPYLILGGKLKLNLGSAEPRSKELRKWKMKNI